MSEPTVPVVPATGVVEVPELTFSYQPKDEHDRPMGGIQVIKYKTQDELNQKLVEQNNLILRQLRKVNREQRLGIAPAESIPTDAEKFDSIVEFKAKPMTAEERFQMTQDLNDPEKFAEARDRLFESAIGLPPAELARVLNEGQLHNLQVAAKQNYDIFASNDPSFFPAQENRQTLTDWMFKNKLAPTVANYKIAYSTLSEAGLLLESPAVRQVAQETPVELEPKQVPVVPEVRINPEAQPQAKRQGQVPSGLNERNSSASGSTPVDANSLTLADIEKIPSEEYKRRHKDPAFRALVDKLEKEAAARRQARNSQV